MPELLSPVGGPEQLFGGGSLWADAVSLAPKGSMPGAMRTPGALDLAPKPFPTAAMSTGPGCMLRSIPW